MKKLLFLISLLFIGKAYPDTRTSAEPYLCIISTGIADHTRSYGDKINDNFRILSATVATNGSDISGLKTSTGSLDSRTTAVELEADALNAGQVNASSYTLQGNRVNLSSTSQGVNSLYQAQINASSYTLQGNTVNISTTAQGVNSLNQGLVNASSYTLQGNTVDMSTVAQGVNALNQGQINASSYTLQGNAVTITTVASQVNYMKSGGSAGQFWGSTGWDTPAGGVAGGGFTSTDTIRLSGALSVFIATNPVDFISHYIVGTSTVEIRRARGYAISPSTIPTILSVKYSTETGNTNVIWNAIHASSFTIQNGEKFTNWVTPSSMTVFYPNYKLALSVELIPTSGALTSGQWGVELEVNKYRQP